MLPVCDESKLTGILQAENMEKLVTLMETDTKILNETLAGNKMCN